MADGTIHLSVEVRRQEPETAGHCQETEGDEHQCSSAVFYSI